MDLDTHTENLKIVFDGKNTCKSFNCLLGGETARTMLRRAWALLRVNTDLLTHAMCWTMAGLGEDPSAYECLTRRLLGGTYRYTVILNDNATKPMCQPGPSGVPNATTYPTDPSDVNVAQQFGGSVHLCVNGRTFQGSIRQHFLRTYGPPVTTYNAMCGAIEMATLLAHELMHSCGMRNDSHRGPPATTCSSADLVEALFRWMLLRRYPHAMQAQCCQVSFGTLVAARFTPALNPTLPGNTTAQLVAPPNCTPYTRPT